MSPGREKFSLTVSMAAPNTSGANRNPAAPIRGHSAFFHFRPRALADKVKPPLLSQRLPESFMNRSSIAALLCLLLPVLTAAKDDYKFGPDSEVQKDVPQGRIEPFSLKSEIFAG